MNNWGYLTPGIPDKYFVRNPKVPMTKEEIRALTISKLQLFKEAVVYDIGAGSGSVTVECALFCKEGKVFAIERKEEALETIKENIKKFSLDNVVVIPGLAPDALLDLPLADRIFIGGSGGQLEEIIKEATKRLKNKGRLVVNSVTLGTGPSAVKYMEQYGYKEIEVTQINISKTMPRGSVHLWQARNPVQIVSGVKEV